jgi:hypothetical protein
MTNNPDSEPMDVDDIIEETKRPLEERENYGLYPSEDVVPDQMKVLGDVWCRLFGHTTEQYIPLIDYNGEQFGEAQYCVRCAEVTEEEIYDYPSTDE